MPAHKFLITYVGKKRAGRFFSSFTLLPCTSGVMTSLGDHKHRTAVHLAHLSYEPLSWNAMVLPVCRQPPQSCQFYIKTDMASDRHVSSEAHLYLMWIRETVLQNFPKHTTVFPTSITTFPSLVKEWLFWLSPKSSMIARCSREEEEEAIFVDILFEVLPLSLLFFISGYGMLS